MNHHNKLLKQLKRKKYMLIYNTSGTWLCASRVESNSIITSSTYAVNFNDKNEVMYLVAMLNADCLQNAYQQTRKSDRDFHTHFWHEIPIPRYTSKNENYKKLVELSKRAEKVAASCPIQTRKAIREWLRENGVAGDIDTVVCKILPNYVAKLDD